MTHPAAVGEEVHDPVTKMRCVRTPATEAVVFESSNFYFCDPANRARFLENPERYVRTTRRSAKSRTR